MTSALSCCHRREDKGRIAGSGSASSSSQCPKVNKKEPERLRVAILGAGVGGCSLALWLREAYGESLDLTVFSDGPVGGRCRSVVIDGDKYEIGATIISELNSHFIDFMSRFSLSPRFMKDLTFIPTGVYDGKTFLFKEPDPKSLRFPPLAPLWAVLSLLKHYGWRALHNLKNSAKGPSAPDFSKLYRLQAEGESFVDVMPLLETLRPNLSTMATRSTESWLASEGIPKELIEELATGVMRSNYGGQTCKDLHALVGLVSLAGGLTSKCFNVVGGNDQVPLKCLEASKADLKKTPAHIVRKVDNGFEIVFSKQDISTDPMAGNEAKVGAPIDAGGEATEEFDVVVVAHPLEHSSLRLEGFSSAGSASQASSISTGRPFRKCVAHLVKASLKREYFHYLDSDGALPLEVLTTAEATSLPFYSIGLLFPVHIWKTEEAMAIRDSALRGEPQVFKVFAGRELAVEELAKFLQPPPDSDDSLRPEVVGWYAYPEYEVPQTFKSFVLDSPGFYYINAIEQAAGCMEMSMIAAKNIANLIAAEVKTPSTTSRTS